MTVIYADLLFGLNLVLDWTLLRMTARIRGIQFLRWRLAAAAGLGTVYAAVLFIPTYPILYTYVGKLLLSILMIILAFGFHNAGYFLKNVGVFYFSAFVIAGGAFGLQYLLQDARAWSLSHQASQWIAAHRTSFQAGIGFLIVALPASYALFRLVWRHSARQQQVVKQLVQLDIYIGDTIRQCTGLVDTGNHLRDPLGGAPVVVTEARLWEGIFPAEWLNRLRSEQPFDMLQSWTGTGEAGAILDESRLRLIPYRGVNRDMQWMIGLRPDSIRIRTESETYVSKKVIIGLDMGTLSHDGAFQAIVHPDLMQDSGREEASYHSMPDSSHRAS
ncbi:sigma-E processing peptidase SpoIIGA [Paenibacillus sp. S-12]|uniref:sigma-E processing peptidase SpoIIGA n=1 Tax=Paenibacillus sp. S-12 TaxID=3031371 RepID=UPI0025A15053|nr:sigma-E processing peptidase SpoIIGA [Paenibacillus sp. S-12]